MPSARKKAKQALSAGDVAAMARANPYLQRLIDDATLRANVQTAINSGKSAYERLTNGKAPGKAVLQDKKLQRDLRATYEAARDALNSLQEGPKRRMRKGLTFGRVLVVAGVGGTVVVVANDKLRSKVLDTLFGAEEEFQYTPPSSAGTTDSASSTPVSAA